MTFGRSLTAKAIQAAGALTAMIWVSGCATATMDGAATQTAPAQLAHSAGQSGNALPAPPPARSTGRAPQTPNLAVTRRTASPQFTDEERASAADSLRVRRNSLADAGRDPIRDQAEFLRQIGRSHGDNTLRQIEER